MKRRQDCTILVIKHKKETPILSLSNFTELWKNLPLADTDAFGFSGMLNLVGEQNTAEKVKYEGLEEVLKLPKKKKKNLCSSLYGKTETKTG